MKKVELLAPAGSFEALEAAINAGADAIYLGGRNFGARHYASNFDNEELIRAVDLAHLHRVRIYVTVNILVDDAESADLVEYLQFLELIGVDAIIVQDLGVVVIARKVAPKLEIHASTQMSIMNSEGVKFAENLGITRVVLARECSLDELAEIKAQTKAELEVFIHGALCVCYSGQCMMSSMIGGRSGNRGRCAQPCRLQYNLVDEQDTDLLSGQAGQYLLSPKDFNTVELLDKLIATGVVSFKIEGRMKRPEYVAIVVETYRKAIDAYYERKFKVSDEDRRNLTQVFNRDFTSAYLLSRPGRTMISDKRPNNRGVQIGRVTSYEHNSKMVGIKLEEDLAVGDGIEFWVTVGGRVTMTVSYIELDGTEVDCAPRGSEVFFMIPAAVRVTDRVFRTFDSKLNKHAAGFWGQSNMKKIPVDAVVTAPIGAPLEIIFTDKEHNQGRAVTDFLGQPAIKRPLTQETVTTQLDRLGNTPFALETLQMDLAEQVMFPISEINEARRKAIDELYTARINAYVPHLEPTNQAVVQYKLPAMQKRRSSELKLNVTVDTPEKAYAAISAGADLVTIAGECFGHREVTPEQCGEIIAAGRKNNTEVIIALPRIVKEFNLAYALDRLHKIARLQPAAVLIGNTGLIEPVRQYKLPFWIDFGLNTFNSAALEYWQNLGAQGALLSPELTFEQLELLAGRSRLHLECLVQGRVEMMVSEYCVAGSFLGNIHEKDCYGACAQKLYLKDRMQEKFPIVTDQFCRMHILNAKELSMLNFINKFKSAGVERIRIDAGYMSVAELTKHIQNYRTGIANPDRQWDTESGYTKGHYFRGVIE